MTFLGEEPLAVVVDDRVKNSWVNSRISEVVMGQDRQRASTYRGV
jgi:hypothetical protein